MRLAGLGPGAGRYYAPFGTAGKFFRVAGRRAGGGRDRPALYVLRRGNLRGSLRMLTHGQTTEGVGRVERLHADHVIAAVDAQDLAGGVGAEIGQQIERGAADVGGAAREPSPVGKEPGIGRGGDGRKRGGRRRRFRARAPLEGGPRAAHSRSLRPAFIVLFDAVGRRFGGAVEPIGSKSLEVAANGSSLVFARGVD